MCFAFRRAMSQPLLAVGTREEDIGRMRIACPSCSAEYEVPDRLLAGAGRTLRCSRCAAEFALPALAPPEPVAEPPPPAPAPAPMPPPDPPTASPPSPPVLVAADDRPRPAALPAASPALVRAWVGSVALVLGGMVALLLFRAPVMQAWPPATRLFSALGLA